MTEVRGGRLSKRRYMEDAAILELRSSEDVVLNTTRRRRLGRPHRCFGDGGYEADDVSIIRYTVEVRTQKFDTTFGHRWRESACRIRTGFLIPE